VASNVTESEQAMRLAERVRTVICNEKFYVDAFSLAVSISVGVALRMPDDTVDTL